MYGAHLLNFGADIDIYIYKKTFQKLLGYGPLPFFQGTSSTIVDATLSPQ